MTPKVAVIIDKNKKVVYNTIVVADNWVAPVDDNFVYIIMDSEDSNIPSPGVEWDEKEGFKIIEPEKIPYEEMIDRYIDNPNIKDLVNPNDPDYDAIIALIDKKLAERN